MALSTYDELQTAIATWINRTDLGAYSADFVAIAEESAYQSLRVKAMETAFAATINNGVISVPTDLLELKSVYLNSNPVVALERKSYEWILQAYPQRSSSGPPRYIARNGSNFEFGPYPDSAYEVRGIYYAKLPALSATNTSNWLTLYAPTILLYGGCMAAAHFINAPEEDIMRWQTLFIDAVRRANAADRRDEMAGTRLTMEVRNTP
jgi:hypothetical protein